MLMLVLVFVGWVVLVLVCFVFWWCWVLVLWWSCWCVVGGDVFGADGFVGLGVGSVGAAFRRPSLPLYRIFSGLSNRLVVEMSPA